MAITSNKRQRRYDPTQPPQDVGPATRGYLDEELSLIALGINASLDVFDEQISVLVTLGNDGTGDLISADARPDAFWLIHTDDPGTDGVLVCTVAGTTIRTIHAGADVAVGAAGVNPDTPNKVNYWSDANGYITVKNRRAGAISFRGYKFGI